MTLHVLFSALKAIVMQDTLYFAARHEISFDHSISQAYNLSTNDSNLKGNQHMQHV